MLKNIRACPHQIHLQGSRLFEGVGPEHLEEIGAKIDLVQLEAGDLLFREGDHGDCFYIVCEGSVCISKLGRAGKQETLRYMRPRDFFGEMALIDGQPRSAQALAVEPTLLGRIDRESFDRILAIAPRQLHVNFLRSVVERLREINAQFITELMRNERLALVGSMANTIIHDLKNPISIIQSCAEILRMKVKDPAVTKFTRMIDRASSSMLDMTQEILDFARGESSLHLQRSPVSAVLDEIDLQLEHTVPENITLIRDVDIQADIIVDVGRFARLILNLIKNALEAMPDGGVLRFAVLKRNQRIVFRVSDTGCGIPEELQNQVFEPFVTFGKSKGTGLGMAIVKSVTEAHGGSVTLHSEVGVGTELEVSLPAACDLIPGVPPPAAA